MPAPKWLWLLKDLIPNMYEHRVRYYGYYSDRLRGARRFAQKNDQIQESIRTVESPVDTRPKAYWHQLILKVEVISVESCTQIRQVHCSG